MTDLLIREDPGTRTTRRRKRAVRRFLARAIVALLVVALGGAAVYLAGPGADPKTDAAPSSAEPATQQAVLVAMTLKGDPSQQADSLTLFGAGAGGPVGLFVPTGTLTTIPGQGFESIGKALAFGRPSLLHLSAENMLGITIDHTLVLDDVSLARLVDAVEGIEIDVTERLLERGEDGRSEVVFAQGTQQMTGAQAAVYMTYRGARETELARFPRMQKVWEAILDKLDSSGADAGFTAITGPLVDPGAVETFGTVLRAIAKAPDGDLLFDVLPAKPIGAGNDSDGYDLDEPAAAERVEKLFAGSLPDGQLEVDGRPRIELRNGVGTPETGEQVASLLVPAGMKIEVTGNAGRFDHEQTKVVVYAATEEAMGLARRVRDLLGMGTIEIGTRAQSVVDVTVVIGKDFVAQ